LTGCATSTAVAVVGFGVCTSAFAVGQTVLASDFAFSGVARLSIFALGVTSAAVGAVNLEVFTDFSTFGLSFWAFGAAGRRCANEQAQ
jgi:hypothetical protein